MSRWIVFVALCVTTIAAFAASDTDSKATVKMLTPTYSGVIDVGGEGFWDDLTVDTISHRLYVSHSTKVMVIDLDAQKVLHEIPNTPGVHGIAIAQEFNHGFISCGADSSVVVFDLKTDSTILKIKLDARKPDAIVYDPFSKQVFAFNGGSENASVIDAKTMKVIRNIPLPGAPEFAVTDRKGHVFVNIEDKSMLVAIDTKSLTAKTPWKLAPGENPSSIAYDAENHRLFSGCRNQFAVVSNADSGTVIASLPIGKGVDGASFDPGTHLLYESTRDGFVTVIRQEAPDKYTVLGAIATKFGSRTMTLDARTHRIYLPSRTMPEKKGDKPGEFQLLVYQFESK